LIYTEDATVGFHTSDAAGVFDRSIVG